MLIKHAAKNKGLQKTTKKTEQLFLKSFKSLESCEKITSTELRNETKK